MGLSCCARRLLRRTESSAPVPWRRRGSRNASYHGYGAQPSVMLDRVGSQHQPPLSWRRASASNSAATTAAVGAEVRVTTPSLEWNCIFSVKCILVFPSVMLDHVGSRHQPPLS